MEEVKEVEQKEIEQKEVEEQATAKKESRAPLILIALLIIAGMAFYFYKIPRTIGNRYIQYDEARREYNLLFGFQNVFGMDISAKADFDIWIKNDGGSQVYAEKVTVDNSNFAHWQTILGKNYLGCIKIPVSKIRDGLQPNGTIYFKVETGSGYFDTSTLSIYNLPVVDYSIAIPELPITASYRFVGHTYTKAEITDIKYEDIGMLDAVKVTAYFEKTYDVDGKSGDTNCMFDYRLIDANGTVVQTGSLVSDRVRVGDKSIAEGTIYDLQRGENYTLEIIAG